MGSKPSANSPYRRTIPIKKKKKFKKNWQLILIESAKLLVFKIILSGTFSLFWHYELWFPISFSTYEYKTKQEAGKWMTSSLQWLSQIAQALKHAKICPKVLIESYSFHMCSEISIIRILTYINKTNIINVILPCSYVLQ